VNNARWTAGALGLAAALLRLPHAFGDSLWQDEVASARIIREPSFGAMLGHVVRTESTPPLWYALAWLVHHAGLSIHDTRLVSVVLDGAVVAGVVLLANRIFPLSLAACAGAFAAVSAQLSGHGHELRAYELFAVLALAFAFTLHDAVLQPTSARVGRLAAVTCAGLLTHYFFAFTVAAGMAWLWLDPTARRARRRVTLGVAAGCAAFAPWLPWFAVQFRQRRYDWIGPFNARVVVATPLRIVTPFLHGPAPALAIAFVVAGAALSWRRGPLGRVCATLALGPYALAAATWAAGVNVYDVRNMIGIAPFLAIVAMAPLASLPARARMPTAAAVCGAAAAGFAMVTINPAAPYSTLAHTLVADGWRPNDAVFVPWNFRAYRSPLAWYLPHAATLDRVPLGEIRGHPAFVVVPRHDTFLVERLHRRPPRHAVPLAVTSRV
jgi:uncharacterized membrane protein